MKDHNLSIVLYYLYLTIFVQLTIDCKISWGEEVPFSALTDKVFIVRDKKPNKSLMQKATNIIQLYTSPKIITIPFCEMQTSIVIWLLF